MKRIASFILFATGLLVEPFCQAEITISTVIVGDPENSPDMLNSGSVPGIGSVSYTYHIGTYKVTNGQYTAFLNAVAATDTYSLYNPNMEGKYGGITRSGTAGSFTYEATRPNAPVNYVSFWDAARFANWLTNGQGSGGTETGVYILTSDGINNNTITRDATAWASGGVAIASENEWYKAAYYSGLPTGADGDGYWLYPTQSNSISTEDANYGSSVGNVTDVGTYSEDASHYGTFDQGGNLWEWNEGILPNSTRGLRGGSFGSPNLRLQSSFRNSGGPTVEDSIIGFRISRIPGPPTWAGYPIADETGNVDTTPWLNWINVAAAPWIYSYGLSGWLYCPEEFVSEAGAWVYLPN
jgi:hypothetical protein